MGSLSFMDIEELVEMAWGVANSQQPFLWVVRPGSIRSAKWIEVSPEYFKNSIGKRDYIMKWIPQKEVLAHGAVEGFLNHCEWNSTLESICERIPIICWPYFGNQRMNARYVSHVWKVGLKLENEMERGEIESQVRRVMAKKEGEDMGERAKNLKKNIELWIKECGTSYKSLKSLVEMIMSF
jgi:hypothetical protein